MQKWMAVVVVSLFLWSGCINAQPSTPLTTQGHVLEKDIPVFGMGGVVISDTLKETIYSELARFPKTHKHIGGIAVILQLRRTTGESLLGMWDTRIVYLTLASPAKVKPTLWHELAHVHATNLTSDQMKEWESLYRNTMLRAKVENIFPMMLQRQMEHIPEGFPTAYSMTNVHEFMAEHFEHYMVNTYDSEKRFPEAVGLLAQHGFMPVD